MSLACSPCKSSDLGLIMEQAAAIGIDRLGTAVAHTVPDSVTLQYRQWIADGMHASMDYLDRYHDLRRDPRLLLDGARTVISCAIGYYHPVDPASTPSIASYAHGDDYHDVVRDMLSRLARFIEERWGAATRVCVDTAPVHERYWAVEAGIAIRSVAGPVIVPGLGSYCFLGEIITTLDLPSTPRPATPAECNRCGACIAVCPGHAINGDGTVDARRCISYLTIEHRGDFPPGTDTHGHLYGCDECLKACRYNAGLSATGHSQFHLRDQYRNLSPHRILAMSHDEYCRLFKGSAIKRAKLNGLKRNAKQIYGKEN